MAHLGASGLRAERRGRGKGASKRAHPLGGHINDQSALVKFGATVTGKERKRESFSSFVRELLTACARNRNRKLLLVDCSLKRPQERERKTKPAKKKLDSHTSTS